MLENEIVKLREAVEALTAALEKNPVLATEDPAPGPSSEPEPVAEKELPKNQDELTLEALKDATLKASRAGHKAAVRKKLNEMSAGKITDLTPEQAVVFYKWVQELVQ